MYIGYDLKKKHNMSELKKLAHFFENIQSMPRDGRVVHEKWCRSCAVGWSCGCTCACTKTNVLVYGKWWFENDKTTTRKKMA